MRMYGKRALLNLPGFESTGAIVAELVESPGYTTDAEPYWEMIVQISDCSRVINLSFNDPADESTTDERFYNDLNKVDVLIDCLTEFRRGMKKVRRLQKKDS